jgi:hypothetical protein
MSRKDNLAGVDPFGADDGEHEPAQPQANQRPELSMSDADAALFGELSRREKQRQVVQPISIFSIYPDVKQPRRAIPSQVRDHWSGQPKEIADLFNVWLQFINRERKDENRPPFNLDDLLWSENVEAKGKDEDQALLDSRVGPIERSFIKVIELAVSIRRDGLANPVTIQRVSSSRYQLETGERRWLAYHILYGYFNGAEGKPQERSKWEDISAIIVDDFSVWRQASENAARADLNAIGRARQFAILLMDLLERQGVKFQTYEDTVRAGQSDRVYYAQVVDHRVPSGKSEMLSNGLGVSHRAAFSRARALLSLPDDVWTIGDNADISEDELLRIAKIEDEQEAIAQVKEAVRKIVATRNNLDEKQTSKSQNKKRGKAPALFTDAALKRGKRLFPKQVSQVAKELFDIRDGVGQAGTGTKKQLRDKIEEMRDMLNQLEEAIDNRN